MDSEAVSSPAQGAALCQKELKKWSKPAPGVPLQKTAEPFRPARCTALGVGGVGMWKETGFRRGQRQRTQAEEEAAARGTLK